MKAVFLFRSLSHPESQNTGDSVAVHSEQVQLWGHSLWKRSCGLDKVWSIVFAHASPSREKRG